MKIIDPEKWISELQNSSGHKKFLNYLREIIESDYFQSFVIETRKKYYIPEKGFLIKEGHWTIPPEDWVGKNDSEIWEQYRKDIDKISDKYHLHHLDGMDIFDNYIFYTSMDFPFSPNSFNVCMVSDLVEEKKEPFEKETQNDDDKLYPIAIRISPYASLRDILDFIRRGYKYEISQLQNKYKEDKVRLGKFKAKKIIIQERNKFIYQNKHLPRRKIMSLIADKFGGENTIDYGYIGKIISNEIKKRKKL